MPDGQEITVRDTAVQRHVPGETSPDAGTTPLPAAGAAARPERAAVIPVYGEIQHTAGSGGDDYG